MSALSINDLRVSYGTRVMRGTQPAGRTVVHGVSFSIDEGETLALVGESGSGKSTTAQAILGLLPEGGQRDSGTIMLGSLDITTWSDRELRGIRGPVVGFVPQDPVTSLNPVRTIGAQIAETLRIHGHRDRKKRQTHVLDLLYRVGIDDPELRARQHPHELSGGMKQRVLIAAAIALRPKLLIADEPTSALDATVQKTVLDLITQIQREEGMSVLLVTHDLGVAADRAHQMVVLNSGKVVEYGASADVIRNPRMPYTQQLLADAPSFITHFRRPHAPTYVRDAAVAASESPFVIEATGLMKQFAVHRRAVGGRTGSQNTGSQNTVRAVDNVSFRVRRGTTHALVGESGSGKTTTARMVTRFIDADDGTISLEGVEVTRVRRRPLRQLRQHIQLVYQNPFASLDPRQNVGEIIAEPLDNFAIGTREERRARVHELLDKVSLPSNVATRTARELSGGQRQRVAIARALAPSPRLVVLDEAVSALDVTVQARILELLESLQDELGVSYLFISHDLAVVRRISHTVSVMQRGRIVEDGPTEEIFRAPQHAYTQQLLRAVPGHTEVHA